MIKGLKIAMIVWAAMGILLGLACIFFPTELGDMQGYEKGPAYVVYFLELLGIGLIVSSAFIIVAAVRDPLKHIMWVQYALASAVLFVVVEIYSLIRGFVNFEQVRMSMITDAAFAVAFLALYPWRAPRGTPQAPIEKP